MYKIIVAEKPSVATVIAKALGVKKREDGYIEGKGYRVTWCIGHMLGLADADAYDPALQKWRMDTLPVLPDEWKLNVLPGREDQLGILRKLMNDEDTEEIINACDAGREGELIFRQVYEYVGCRKPVKRLWLSSMEDDAIRAAMENLKPGSAYDRLAEAAKCREYADWLVGINATRLYSLMYRRTLNVGRVVSPTLAMVAERQQAIRDFKPEDYHTVAIEGMDFKAVSGHFANRADAEKLAEACRNEMASVESVSEEPVTENAPGLYDLTTLQRDANRMLHFTAQKTLDLAQSLYTKKLCTYPRTDSGYLTDDMKDSAGNIVSCAAEVLHTKMPENMNTERLCDSRKVTDHYALIPTETARTAALSQLSADERELLKLICLRTLIAAAEPYKYVNYTAQMTCAGAAFTAKGRKETQIGWKAYARKEEKKYDPFEIEQGEKIRVSNAKVRDEKTRAPKPYTDDTLLKAMQDAGDMPKGSERKGLGTPATRAGIIEKLMTSRFARRDEKTGAIISNFESGSMLKILPDVLKTPQLTADWEYKLLQVERGELSAEKFMEQITDLVYFIVRDSRPVGDAEELFPSGREKLGTCPRCGGTVVETPKGYFCQNAGCSFSLWKDNMWLAAKHITPTKEFVSALLRDGQANVNEIWSERSGRTYNGIVHMDVTDPKFTRLRVTV